MVAKGGSERVKTRVQDELLTVQEFAEKAGVSVQAVYKRLNNLFNLSFNPG